MGYEIGGAKGADALCNTAAENAGLFTSKEKLKHPMRAWLSDVNHDAFSRGRFGKGGYFLPRTGSEKLNDVDPILVFASLESLMNSGILDHAINRDQFGEDVPTGYVWTNTGIDGKASSLENKGTCNHWQMECWDNAPCDGLVGQIDANDGGWALLAPPSNASYCGEQNHLYCFESLWDVP